MIRYLSACAFVTVLNFAILTPAGAATLPVLGGLQLHLDASTITGLNPSDPVANWDDLSPFDNDATASGSSQPLYITGAVNGLPAVRFDGVNDAMNTASTTTIGSAFVVGNVHTGSDWANYTVFAGAVGTNNHLFLGDLPNSPNLYFSTASLFPSSSVLIDGTATTNFAPLQQFKSLYGYALSPSTAAIRLGHDASGGNFGNIDLAEVIVYDHQLSADDLNAVGFYLQDKYGLASNFTAPPIPVPEPSTLVLLASAACIFTRFRQGKKSAA